MKAKPFGLDIGGNSMKLVWLGEDKNGYLLKSAISEPTPPKGVLSESPFDQEEMALAVKKTASDGKITTPYVNIALPENQVYTRVVEMPVLSDRELASAIYWEAEQQIPVPLSAITLDWNVLKRSLPNEVNGKMIVLLVGASTLLIEKYQNILSLAGFTINAIETEVLSVIRALVVSDTFPPSLVLNIGAISTSLAIVKDGTIIFTYTIPLGGIAISRAIASYFGFSMVQADEYKKVYGISQDVLGGKIGKATEPILSSILGEVKKAITFYTGKYKNDAPIEQILLSGGTAKLAGIDLFFANRAGIETAVATPWNVLSTGQNIPKNVLANGADYTVAIGLAMRDYE